MNLGAIYVKTALCVVAGAILLPFVAAWIIHVTKKWSWRRLLPVALLLACVLVPVGLNTLHHPLFVTWHRAQNTMAPRFGCLRYEPRFTYLLATYRMDRSAFDQWVAAHPWKLSPSDLADVASQWDGEHLGFHSPEALFATQRAANGKQLRVYYERGVVYLVYNAM